MLCKKFYIANFPKIFHGQVSVEKWQHKHWIEVTNPSVNVYKVCCLNHVIEKENSQYKLGNSSIAFMRRDKFRLSSLSLLSHTLVNIALHKHATESSLLWKFIDISIVGQGKVREMCMNEPMLNILLAIWDWMTSFPFEVSRKLCALSYNRFYFQNNPFLKHIMNDVNGEHSW